MEVILFFAALFIAFGICLGLLLPHWVFMVGLGVFIVTYFRIALDPDPSGDGGVALLFEFWIPAISMLVPWAITILAKVL